MHIPFTASTSSATAPVPPRRPLDLAPLPGGGEGRGWGGGPKPALSRPPAQVFGRGVRVRTPHVPLFRVNKNISSCRCSACSLAVAAAGPAAPPLGHGLHDRGSAAPGPRLLVRLRSRSGAPQTLLGAPRPRPPGSGHAAPCGAAALQPCPAPLRVARRLSFGGVGADLPDGCRRRHRQSVDSADSPLSPRRAPPPAGRPEAGQPTGRFRLSRRPWAPVGVLKARRAGTGRGVVPPD